MMLSCKQEKPKPDDTLSQQASDLAQAIKDNNFELLADYTHPNLLELYGGKEAFVKLYKADVEKDPYNIINVNFYQMDTLIQTPSGFQSIVYFQIEAELEGKLMESVQAMVSISDAEGQDWKFIQLSANFEELKKLIPEVSEKLFIQ